MNAKVCVYVSVVPLWHGEHPPSTPKVVGLIPAVKQLFDLQIFVSGLYAYFKKKKYSYSIRNPVTISQASS